MTSTMLRIIDCTATGIVASLLQTHAEGVEALQLKLPSYTLTFHLPPEWTCQDPTATEDSPDLRKLVASVLLLSERHAGGGNLQSVEVYVAARRPAGALCDPEWAEWHSVLEYGEGRKLLVAHLQRKLGADVERHS